MAVIVWSGGAGDGNWNTGTNWVGGTKPANNDTAIVGSTNQAIIGGNVTETGLTVVFTKGFGGTVGADAPLIFVSGTGTQAALTYGGSGSYANFGNGGTVTACTLNVSGGQTVVLSSGTWTTVTSSGGNVQIAASTVVTTLQNVGAVVTALAGTAFTTATNAGTLYTTRSCTTLNCKRGTAIQYNNGVTTYTSCTTVNIENGATYNKQSGGTDTTVNNFPGGTFTIAGNAGNSAATVTITTYNQWSGSKSVESMGGVTVTVGTRNYVGEQSGPVAA